MVQVPNTDRKGSPTTADMPSVEWRFPDSVSPSLPTESYDEGRVT